MNSSRGNKDFGKGDTEHSEAIGNSSSTYTWEPRDEVKGDIARMMFYMDVRYAGQDSDVPNLELVNYTNTPAETTDNKLYLVNFVLYYNGISMIQ
ncbi:endonuclease [Moritella sp. 36]|uniref:endonuclease n=1 Tax=Moritella sp. 36 TaxID=2746233 RepID=UPI001BA595C5|nr:endonuclease [Moritella sp. 36]